VLVRIAIFTIVVGAVLVGVSRGALLERVGLLGSCRAVATPRHGEGAWQECREGRLEGRPDLRRDSCKSVGIVDGLEYWQCPAPVSGGRGLKH
jgi:hypothetical protein